MCRCRDQVWFSLLFSLQILKMSSKSANILFDDMFTIQDVDSARFERGASPNPLNLRV